ncbi:MAG: exo-alpha-sialidase, partial [Actinobacteria bacterium]
MPAVVLVVAASLLAPAAGAAPAPPGFHAPVLMPGSAGGTEPSLAISNSGVRYVSWQSPGKFAGSADGVNFEPLATPDPGASGDVTNAVSYSGALYNGQICGDVTILHSCIYRSLDGGHSWTTQNILADNHPGASDRPWIDVYPKKNTTPTASDPDKDTVYLEFHTFSPDDLVYVTVSHDGGATFSPPHVIESDTNADDSTCNTIPGGITVDQDTGTVYALWLSGNDVESNVQTGCNYTQIGPFNKAWVSTSTDGGNTWSSSLAWEGAFNATTKIGDNADKIFSTITVDSGHQVHIALSVRHNDDPVGFVAACTLNSQTCQEDPQPTDLYLVTSPDQGRHWTAPFKINKTTGSFFFPWLAAGSAGIVDSAYYSSSTLQPNKPTSVWFVGFSQITGAVATYRNGPRATYASTPVATDQILLDPNPIHGDGTTGGGICTFGIFCSAVPGANRGLADVFEVHVDPAGGANVAWTKDLGGRRIYFACQDSGASAFAGAPNLNGCYGQVDISVTKTDSPDPVHVGQNLTYTITVTNGGP